MRKVLVVDDDEALRRLMRLELGDSYEVIDSGEPEHGLALALEHQPDAIVLDLRMPKYSGYELLQTFTSFSHTQKVPVIIVSGEGGGQTKEHCEQLGAAGYFEKPIDFDRLRERLKQVTNNRRHIPRSEVRVKLSVALRLKGTDGKGENFNEVATTEEISLSGFLCRCNAQLPASSILDVYLSGNSDEYVGKVRIIHPGTNNTNTWRYGCRFIEKVGPWVLR
jgi:DNA-binding response OmpR family regulator